MTHGEHIVSTVLRIIAGPAYQRPPLEDYRREMVARLRAALSAPDLVTARRQIIGLLASDEIACDDYPMHDDRARKADALLMPMRDYPVQIDGAALGSTVITLLGGAA